MINKIFSNQIFKIIQRRNFQYSKIDRFIEQLSKDEFYFSPKNQTGNGIIFTNLMKNLNEMKSYGFNYQLTEYLQQYPITSEQIVILLQNLQSNSMYCSNANKSLLLKAMKKELTHLNDKITIILQHGFSLGINDSEILNQYLEYFEMAKLENFSYNQLFDILFVIAQAATNQKVSFKLNEFSAKWSQLINLLTNSLETKETFYVKKYPHFAFIMKGICKMQDNQNQKQMLADLESLFLQTAQKFTENKYLNYLDSKEYTILFSSINFLKLHIKSEILENLVEEMIQHLLLQDFQQYNDLSLQSLALTFTFIPQHQTQLQAKLFQQMMINQEKQKYNIKAYLSILYEIIFKWKYSFFDKHELYIILNDMKVSEQSDYDIAQYFQILTTLNNNQILEILKNKERELKFRKEKNAKLDYYKPDQISLMRLKKSLNKIEGRIRDYKPIELESQLLQRILTLFS